MPRTARPARRPPRSVSAQHICHEGSLACTGQCSCADKLSWLTCAARHLSWPRSSQASCPHPALGAAGSSGECGIGTVRNGYCNDTTSFHHQDRDMDNHSSFGDPPHTAFICSANMLSKSASCSMPWPSSINKYATHYSGTCCIPMERSIASIYSMCPPQPLMKSSVAPDCPKPACNGMPHCYQSLEL